jgi:epoxyqueuosine reductase QueG
MRAALSTELKGLVQHFLAEASGAGLETVTLTKCAEVDNYFKLLAPWYERALAEFAGLGLPQQHCDLLRKRFTCESMVHRVSALCATVILAGVFIYEKELGIG